MKNRSFYIFALSLALPSIIQQLVTNVSQLVDNFMVGKLNEVSISGVSIANQVFFIFTVVVLGLSAAGGIFISQYRGAQNDEKVTEVFRVVLIFNIITGIIFFLLMNIIPEKILYLFTEDKATVAIAMTYMGYIKYTFLIYSIAIAISGSFRYCGLVKVSMYIAIISVLTNVFFNYCFIYGNLGFPNMGVSGAGLATLIARIVEVVIAIGLAKVLDTPIKTRIKDMFKFERFILKNYITRGYGLVINEFFWAFGIQMTNVIFTQRISSNIAALSIANAMINLIFIGMGGMSVAISIIVGKSLGKSNFEQAKVDSKKLLKLSAFVGQSLGIIILIVSYVITGFYEISDSTRSMARLIITIAACFSWLYYLNTSSFFTLRAGGDTKSVLLMDSGFMWVISIPIAFLFGVLHLYMPLHYFLVQLLDLLKLVVARHRYRKGVWLNNLTIHKQNNA
ncbi:putative MATE family efflux protein [Breznakia sp. PF5-3]|uniref:MATE family efflux transporter n=1 Tax=unclassified Breznakia TaxID=2623764 RepID=UPI0024071915|nr:MULTISPECIES: MATE family efflux transporter [unclassified Breznakia]MDF9824194.1 putative MATE family efflux protein [Breznakia sp. PM6-1]MDF9834992.1 putative MATE family efflux protein [Breznakia sp. PF5-3]MDF9837237.1 putative MATE family efflux protein [Breznakia sp. PFB2-8]MDF9859227.1 putative MATE family efflux protein [Breznakia sp. PH5-24]